ncbi:hypothetical protein [Tsukamurella soli]|uniref:Uncharacterized protein n=1 Tax=Tsukamurella soli TaxID=644556 RepID=A0ABP8KIF0_9ACTN
MWWIAIALPVALALWMLLEKDPVDYRAQEMRRAVAARGADRAAAARRVRWARRRLAWSAQTQAAARALHRGPARGSGRRSEHGLAGAH